MRVAEAGDNAEIFNRFICLLEKADNCMVIYHLIEILTVLALRGGPPLIKKCIEISWMSLHAVYSVDDITSLNETPFVITNAVARESMLSTTASSKALQNELIQIIEKLQQHGETGKEADSFRHKILRHWGLLLLEPGRLSRKLHLCVLIDELETFVESLHSAVDGDSEDEKKENTYDSVQDSLPKLPFLGGPTFSDFFEMLFLMAAGCFCVSCPEETTEGPGPYITIMQCIDHYSRLLDMYQRFFVLFPQNTSVTVLDASRRLLRIAVCQMNRCVVWRISQPLLQVEERSAGAYDKGSIVHLEELLNSVNTFSSDTITKLCDFWQSRKSPTMISRGTRLRQAAEKATESVRRIALTHNCTTSSSCAGASEARKTDDVWVRSSPLQTAESCSESESHGASTS